MSGIAGCVAAVGEGGGGVITQAHCLGIQLSLSVVTMQVILEQVIHSDSANIGTSDKSGDPASMILYTEHTWKMCQTRKNRCSAPPAAQLLLMRCHGHAVAA